MSEQLANAAETKLNGAIDDSQTTLVVFNSTGFPATGNFRIRIDKEIMKVTGRTGNTWTVERAVEDVSGLTQATGHLHKTPVRCVLTKGSLAQYVSENGGGGSGGSGFFV